MILVLFFFRAALICVVLVCTRNKTKQQDRPDKTRQEQYNYNAHQNNTNQSSLTKEQNKDHKQNVSLLKQNKTKLQQNEIKQNKTKLQQNKTKLQQNKTITTQTNFNNKNSIKTFLYPYKLLAGSQLKTTQIHGASDNKLENPNAKIINKSVRTTQPSLARCNPEQEEINVATGEDQVSVRAEEGSQSC